MYVLGRGKYGRGEVRVHHTDQIDRKWRCTTRELEKNFFDDKYIQRDPLVFDIGRTVFT